MNLQSVLFDDRVRPDLRHQRVLGNEFAFGLHERFDDVEGAASERQDCPPRAQLAAPKVELPPGDLRRTEAWSCGRRGAPGRTLSVWRQK
jgi:hypothetical protein